MDKTRDSDLGLVDDANEIESGLNEWEMNFVEDMNKQLEDYPTLTDPQRSKLKQILSEKG